MAPKAPRVIGGRARNAPAPTVQSVSQSSKNGEYVHVSVRQIDNGYIVRREVESKDGYKTSEVFAKNPPKLVVK